MSPDSGELRRLFLKQLDFTECFQEKHEHRGYQCVVVKTRSKDFSKGWTRTVLRPDGTIYTETYSQTTTQRS